MILWNTPCCYYILVVDGIFWCINKVERRWLFNVRCDKRWGWQDGCLMLTKGKCHFP